MTWRVIVGDALERLRELEDGSVQTCVTSPPYFGLRDYGTGEWAGGEDDCDHIRGKRGGGAGASGLQSNKLDPSVKSAKTAAVLEELVEFAGSCGKCGATRTDSQVGLEATPDEYVARLVEVFREVRRVLRDDGTLWLNLGSSYFNGESYPIRDIDAAWLAAIIDGEGCIQIHQQRRPARHNCVDSFQVDLGVGMMTPEVVQRCHEITGLGSCKQQNRGVWDWSVRGQQAAQLLRAIYPYLIGKKPQAALAIMLANDLAARKYGRGNPAQPEVMEWRAQIRKAVSDCNQRRGTDMAIAEPQPITLNAKPKDDLMIPHRVYRALMDDGWYGRMDIVWAKKNCMPESVTDRPTKSHEFVFLLSKSPRYFYDADAVREGDDVHVRKGTEGGHKLTQMDGYKGIAGGTLERDPNEPYGFARDITTIGRNKRSVWTVATQPFPGAHFAVFPPKLIEPCVKAGSAEDACGVCGAPWVRVVETDAPGTRVESEQAKRVAQRDGWIPQSEIPHGRVVQTLGFEPSCAHLCSNHPDDVDPQPPDDRGSCVVLDPFSGAGTTGLVATRLGRSYVGIELNPVYAEMSRERIRDDQPLFNWQTEAAVGAAEGGGG